ncbi:hypothetical protein Tco_1531303 [Tanacetum coccineum]
MTVCRGVARDYTRIAFLAELRSSCSLPLGTDYAPCGTAELILLAAVCRLGSLRSDCYWPLWAFPSVGLGPVAYHRVQARGPDDVIPHDMWIAIERLQQGESLNIQDVKSNLFWEFGRFTSHDGESMESYYSSFYKMMNEMIRNNLTVATMQVNVQFLQQLQPEWSSNNMTWIQSHITSSLTSLLSSTKSHKSYAPPSKQASSTISNAPTKHKGKEIAKPITPPSESASEEDTLQTYQQQPQNFFKLQKQECGYYSKGVRKTKREKDYTYHNEKILLCKQAEKGVPLQAEQVDWLEDTNEEIDEQELETHYSFMAKIQEVLPPESNSNDEPLEQVPMDDPNITMDEYIRLEKEKAHRRGKVYDWETATYGKIWDNEDVHNLGYVETEFPAIVFNDTLTSEATLSCKPTVSSLNNDEIDFRISFDESDDEDCTVIFDKNSFFYKIISVNNLKTDSENDNDKVNMPLLPSPEPTVSYFDDLDYFKDFEKEFPAIVYNDAQMSKLNFLTEPTLSPQHIDEFNLKDETSLSEFYPDDLKSDKDNDDDKIDIQHSLGDLSVKLLPNVINTDVGAYAHGSNKLLETSIDMTYPGDLAGIKMTSLVEYLQV